MPRITPIHWRKFEKFLIALGCVFQRQEGDHRIYWKQRLNRPIVVPTVKDLPVFIIRNNIRTLQISQQQYLSILEGNQSLANRLLGIAKTSSKAKDKKEYGDFLIRKYGRT